MTDVFDLPYDDSICGDGIWNAGQRQLNNEKRKEPKMAKIIEDRHHETVTWREHNFHYKDDPGSGYSFPVEENEDDVNIESLNEAARKNYKYCLSGPKNLMDDGIVTHSVDHIAPALLQCKCGEKMYLENPYYGAYCCPECGQWYNDNGDELNPPEEWLEPLEPDEPAW